MMRVPEVAETLGVSRATVVRLIDSGELVATDVGSQSVPAPRRNWRVSEYHLVQFTNRRLV
jgi:excisionase family DNA binding protein